MSDNIAKFQKKAEPLSSFFEILPTFSVSAPASVLHCSTFTVHDNYLTKALPFFEFNCY